MTYARTTGASRRAARPPLRYLHVSAPVIYIRPKVKNEQGDEVDADWTEPRVLVGTTYRAGRNALKRESRRASVLHRLAERIAR